MCWHFLLVVGRFSRHSNKKLSERFREPTLSEFFHGLFPKDHPKNIRFAINYYTAIGLGVLTEDLRDYLEKVAPELAAQAKAAAAAAAAAEEASDSDSDSSSSSSSSSDSSDSS